MAHGYAGQGLSVTSGILGLGAGTQTAISATVVMADSNGMSWGMSGSTRITASFDGIRSVSAGTTQGGTSKLVFADGNGVSFGYDNGTITASVAGGTAFVTGIGVSTGGNTAGDTGTTHGRYVLVGVGAVSLSQTTGAGSLATVSISAPAQTTQPGIQSISAGTTRITTGEAILSDANNVTFGADGQTITARASISERLSLWSHNMELVSNWTVQNGILSIQRVQLPLRHTMSQLMMVMDLTGASGSSGALTVSAGVYTMAGSTASLSTSASRELSWTSGSETSASSRYGGVSGTRYRTLAINVSMTPGDYLVGIWMRTTNNGTWRVFGLQRVSIAGALDTNETRIFLDGITSASFSTALPASIDVTNTGFQRTGQSALRQPGLIFVGSF